MYFDVLMPSILFAVTLVALLLESRAEKKLKATVEEREFKNRDVALLVFVIGAAITIVTFVPQMAILALFLFSYSSLLFTVSYAFSDMRTQRVVPYCGLFIVASILAAVAGGLGVFPAEWSLYGTLAFAGLAVGALVALMFALRSSKENAAGKQRWYLAALSPILFLLLFGFFSDTPVWFPFLLDVYGIMFAILIVLYMGTLFTWKTVFIFAAFLTILDIILVWGTQTMVQVATEFSGLGLPVLVAFPTVPFIYADSGIRLTMLGLGDFFFAGILGTQTMKKFGKKAAVISVLTMCISFGLFELVLLNKELADLLPVRALPATLPIVLGWLPVVAYKVWNGRKTKTLVSENRN